LASLLKDKDATRLSMTAMNGGMGPYGRPAERGMPPEPPLWHGHAWQPTGVEFMQGVGMFSDGYIPGPKDKPQF